MTQPPPKQSANSSTFAAAPPAGEPALGYASKVAFQEQKLEVLRICP